MTWFSNLYKDRFSALKDVSGSKIENIPVRNWGTYYFSLDVETHFMPWLMDHVQDEVKKVRVARALLDSKYNFILCLLMDKIIVVSFVLSKI